MRHVKRFSDDEMKIIEAFRRREISPKKAIEMLGLSKTAFYSLLARHFEFYNGVFPKSNGEPLVSRYEGLEDYEFDGSVSEDIDLEDNDSDSNVNDGDQDSKT